MNDITLGKLIEGHAERDAIHVAVYPCIAQEPLIPGEHVTANGHKPYGNQSAVGVVDPFLKNRVNTGQAFWLMLYQKTITGMRHHWSHPAFPIADANPEPVPIKEAKAAIELIASQCGCSYDEIMEFANVWVRYGDYTIQGGRFEGIAVHPDFWKHFKTITGLDGSGHFFSCSC